MRDNNEEIRKKVAELLRQLKCSQHTQRKVNEILIDYPSLIDEVQECINNGAKKVEIRAFRNHTKPAVAWVEANKCVVIYINY